MALSEKPASEVRDEPDGTHPRPPVRPVIDGIDSSQWLPRDASVVNPHREAKGDLNGKVEGHGKTRRIVAAQVIDRSLLSELIRRGTLDEHHGYYASVFLDMRRYFRRLGGISGNPLYAKEFLSVSNSGVLESLYLRVCRLIGRDHERTITTCLQTAIYRPAENDPDREAMNAEIDRVLAAIAPQARLAFDTLVRSIDEARKEIDGAG